MQNENTAASETTIVSNETVSSSADSPKIFSPVPKPGLNVKRLRAALAAFFLLLLILGATTALYLTQVNQDIRNQASTAYAACPPGVGGNASNLSCSGTGGGECSGVESCHPPGGYDDCEPLPGTNQCYYAYGTSKCVAQCPGNMGGGAKRCHCSNGQWTIGKGGGCDEICKCSGNDCPTCKPTKEPTDKPEKTPTPTSTSITVTPSPTRIPSISPTPTTIISITPSPTPEISLTPTPTSPISPTPTSELSPTPTPPIVGPQCYSIAMYTIEGQEITGDMDQALSPGSPVRFRCGATGGTPDRYEFRVRRPDGVIEDKDTNLALEAVGSTTGNYALPLSGSYAVQCRICVGTDCHPYEDLPAVSQ